MSTVFWIVIAAIVVVVLGLGAFAIALCRISKSDNQDLMP
jgi:hypothetical protein